MLFVDTHSHLYLSEFDNDIDKIIVESKQLNITKHILPSIDSKNYSNLMNLVSKDFEIFFPLIGLHPCSVKDDWKKEISFVESKIKEHKFFGIGETGIDLYWDKTYINEQKLTFEIQLQLAINNNLPIVIHQRNSFKEIFEILENFRFQNLKGVFHCFAGDTEIAFKCIDYGFLLGVGGVVTYKNSLLAEVVSKIDLKNLILETDSPFLPPVPHRGKRNQPTYLPIIASKIAEIKNIDIEEVAEKTSENAVSLFNLTKT